MDQEYQELKKWLEQTADEPLETMAAFFDRRIDGYEEHMSPWEAHYRWMAPLLPEGTETLLDIGCGSGLELDRIFERFPRLQVTGIDLSDEMLALLQKKHGMRELSLIQADYFSHPLKEGFFDAAVSFETLHHFTAAKKKGLFERLCRALKPGGVYLECDYIAASQAIEDLTFAECARRRQRDKISPDRFVHFDTPLTLEHEMQAMRDAGFSSVELIGYLPGDNHTPMLRALR